MDLEQRVAELECRTIPTDYEAATMHSYDSVRAYQGSRPWRDLLVARGLSAWATPSQIVCLLAAVSLSQTTCSPEPEEEQGLHVAEIRKDIEEMREDMTALSLQIDTLQTSLVRVNGGVDLLGITSDTLRATQAALTSRLNKVEQTSATEAHPLSPWPTLRKTISR